jgi:hypothetical protein
MVFSAQIKRRAAMSDQAIDPVELAEAEKRTAEEAADYAKRMQYARSDGGPVDPGIGNMGGAGASGTMGPDLGKIAPLPGNSSDLPKE